MERKLAALVRRRANHACEYCRFPESQSRLPFLIDHIRARQHKGKTTAANLALACPSCNLHKGPNLTGIDDETGRVVRLFNPRRQRWADHFRWEGLRVVGMTSVGRVTVEVLSINDPRQLIARLELVRSGWSLSDLA